MGRILVATDDAPTLAVIGAELAGAGHEVVEALTGQDAYEAALAETPDLVILDAELAVFDGFETARMIRDDPDMPPRLPVILLHGVDLDPHKVEKSGATGVFPKSHSAPALFDLLVTHLSPEAL